ncbi:Alpha/Beta hydrolase protein [Peziza echinospora]|nr:Alpha/Beta hydrolase protein [Peziza echinospora]
MAAKPDAAPEQPQSTNPMALRGPLFPLGYKEGFTQWWACVAPAIAESTVLSFLPFHPAPHALNPPLPAGRDPRVLTSSHVQLSKKDHYLNELKIEHQTPAAAASTETTPASAAPQTLVILHGYGAGLGFFYKNYAALTTRPNWTLYSLDLLGMGNSSRPPFKIHAKTHDAKITEAEDFFIDALEEWRVKRGIERFTLMGHSLGGYLSAAYALKYPGRLNKLILASPAGIPEDPWTVQSSPLPDELPADQAPPPPSASAPPPPTAKPRRQIPGWFKYLWDQNLSPFALIRWSGPFGPLLTSGWTSRRFSLLPAHESEALHNYAYSLFRQRGSGEYALAYILAAGAFARHPMVRRIGPVGVPTVLMYGEHDWMDVAGGYAAAEVIRSQGLRRDEEGWQGGREWRGENLVGGVDTVEDGEVGGGEAKVLVVKRAGHHLYLDNWEEFNEMIEKEMVDVEVREEVRRRKREGEGETKVEA